MILQEYLGQDYQVTKIIDEKGKVSFNVKREEFDYTTSTYEEAQLPKVISLIGNAVETKYSNWKFGKELK